jgi:hypothetical protein
MCAEESLCIVAFLDQGSAKDSQIMDLGRIKADMKEGTELYSVDKG